MLKHKELIEQLTVTQKIALLVSANVPAGEHEELAGIPQLRVADLWEGNTGDRQQRIFPSAASLMHSWNPALLADVAACLVERGARRGTNMFILPEAKAPFSVYGKGLADDPVLIAALMRATSDAVQGKGAGICMQAPLLSEQDVGCLHGEVDACMLYDRTAKPFAYALPQRGCQAVLQPQADVPERYLPANVRIMQQLPADIDTVSIDVDHDHTVAALCKNQVLFGASATALEAALENYANILRSIEEGGATVEDLNAALADGSAISEDMLDAALDRRLALGASCTEQMAQAATGEHAAYASMEACTPLALTAARESIVLLKNEKKMLPLHGKKRIVLVGDIINHTACAAGSFKDELLAHMEQQDRAVFGYARGYALERDRSEELIPEAVELVKDADVAMVFLGMGKEREAMTARLCSLQLPANQLALMDALFRTGKPIIAVVMGSRLPAMAFDRRAKAVLFMPEDGMQLALALTEVLTDRYNPSGRLAFGGYDDPDADYRESQRLMRTGKKKTGPFIGYRYTVSERVRSKYAFGFGLSYSEVAYSKLAIENGIARFTLHNKSKSAVIETVQLYVGKVRSAILRPRMELQNFVRVFLEAGESRTVELPLGDWSIYDPASGACVVEEGEYDVYIAASAEDIRLTGKVSVAGEQLERREHKRSDYLHSISDIRSNRYTMEGYCEPMKTRTTLKTLGALLIWLTLFADVLYMTACLLSLVLIENTLLFAVLGSIGGIVVGVVLLALHKRLHAAKMHLQAEREREATAELFRGAEIVETEALEDLFAAEFDIPEVRLKREEETYTESDEGLYAYMSVDTELPLLAQDMARFFKERGMVLSPAFVKTALSALMTSRLLIVRAAPRGTYERFVRILGEFFGTEVQLQSFADRNEDEGTLLRGKTPEGTVYETNALQAFYAAQNQREKAHFVGVAQVVPSQMGRLLIPYIRYFSNPQESCIVTEDDITVEVPHNLWFVLGVADGSSLEDIDPFVANLSVVVDLCAESTVEQPEKTPVKPVTCPEMEALVYRSKKSTTVDEELWKLVDRLESFVSERAPYHIGNKQFLQMERYIAVYEACGGQLKAAMDSVVAAKLLPAILALLKDKRGEEDVDLIQTVESIFGEEYTAQCRYLLKHAAWQQSEDAAAAEQVHMSVNDTRYGQVTDASGAWASGAEQGVRDDVE